MPYIYKITNTINNKVYIGKTVESIEERWKEHCHDYKRHRCEKRPLYNAMNKYGIENFTIAEIEQCDLSILNEREIYWIKFFNSYETGYNATKGGDGTVSADYDLIYKLYQHYKLMSVVMDLTGYDRSTVAKALESYGIDKNTRKVNSIAAISKPVAKCDLKTGEVLEVYPSVVEAERQNGNPWHIADVCKGKRKSCKGYSWKYL